MPHAKPEWSSSPWQRRFFMSTVISLFVAISCSSERPTPQNEESEAPCVTDALGVCHELEQAPPDHVRGWRVDIEAHQLPHRPRRVYESLRCERGEADGCLAIAQLWDIGADGPRSSDRAHEMYDRACTAGSPIGCNELGVLDATTATSDDTWHEARLLFETACAGGEMKGCHNAAIVWEWGQGEEQDLLRARTLYERGCSAGIAESCRRLARMWKWGWGGPSDRDKAAEYQQRGRLFL